MSSTANVPLSASAMRVAAASPLWPVRRAVVAGARAVGRAEIAGADGADVGGAGEPRQDQPERDRAAEIAEDQRRGISRQQRRIEPWRHGCFPTSELV